MSTLGERIKILRKDLGLTQQKFANRISQSRNSVARYEIDLVTPSATALALICRTFKVNENWLRTGEGEMFIETDSSILAELAAEYALTDAQQKLVAGFLNLTNEQREVIVDAVCAVADEIRATAQSPAPPPAPVEEDDVDVEAAVEEYRQRLLAAKKVQPKSVA